MRQYTVLYLLLIALVSCDKEPDGNPALIVSESNDATGQPVIVPVDDAPVYPLKPNTDYFDGDWESLQTMPVPPGTPAIPTPWSDNARRKYNNAIRYDYKKADGWEWVTGSFSTTLNVPHKSFVLYNRYRGVMRAYYYIGTGTQNVRDYNLLVNSLFVGGFKSESSPLMNFAGQDIVDVTTNAPFASRLEPFSIDDNSWYVLEFEMAFDRNLPANSYQDLGVTWAFSFAKSFAISVNNVSYNQLPVAIQKAGFNFLDFVAVYVDEVDLVLFGENDLDAVSSSLPSADREKLSEVFDADANSTLLNGVIPASNPNYSAFVHWGATISLNREVNGVGVVNMNFVLPGQDGSNVQGVPTLYNFPPGVFYLEQRPVVLSAQHTSASLPYEYKLDATTVRYLFNPAVLKSADIQNLRQEIIATEGSDLLHDFRQATLYKGQVISSNKPLTIQGVRVSFDVVPKDGTTKVKIVKTFKADVLTD
jgi:hypothetical protein